MNKLDEANIKKDRLRFTKNKFSANMIILAIVVNALYFVNIYRSDVGNYYYKIMIGASIVPIPLASKIKSNGLNKPKINCPCLVFAGIRKLFTYITLLNPMIVDLEVHHQVLL